MHLSNRPVPEIRIGLSAVNAITLVNSDKAIAGTTIRQITVEVYFTNGEGFRTAIAARYRSQPEVVPKVSRGRKCEGNAWPDQTPNGVP